MGENHRQELLEALVKIKRAMARSHMIAGIPHPALDAMKAIRRCDRLHPENPEAGVTMSDLSRLMGISKPAVTQIINDLEHRGCVERVSTKNDRRLVYVQITKTGEEILLRGEREFQEKLEIVVRSLGEKDTQELIRIITKLSVCLENTPIL